MTLEDPITLYTAEFSLERVSPVNRFVIDVLDKVLETSSRHDQFLSSRMDIPVIDSSDIWVLTQYQIELYQVATQDQKIRIDTQIVAANRVFITRYFRVFQAGDLLMEVYIQFVAINFQDRNIVRLNLQGLEDLKVINPSQKFKFKRIKLPSQIMQADPVPVKIQAEDIDFNNHVNNLVYLSWCFDLLKNQTMENYESMTISVKYGQELLLGHQVAVYPLWQKEAGHDEAYFLIYNQSKKEEASSISIQMKEK